ncbi:putative methyltransferase-domain-containing protein [Umbelopsis sp. AD052]|nr:putative methyltransferase-domain-containing protein [Umbelopsis sp. AD052]
MPTPHQIRILEERRRKREESEPEEHHKPILTIEGPRFPGFQFQKPATQRLGAPKHGENYFYINNVPVWLSDSRQDMDEEEQDHVIRTASSLWDCGVILAKYLEKHPTLVCGKHVIELGAGKALPSIAAAALGARVVVTDAADAMNAAQHVADINDLHVYGRGPGWIESIQPLDWLHREKDLSQLPHPPFDIVLCSDVVWVEYLVPHLVQTMAELPLAPGGVILLAHQTRSLRIDNILFESLQTQGFTLTKIEKYELHPDYTKDGVCIWKIYRKLCHT